METAAALGREPELMRHRRTILGSLALAGVLAAAGCTHNHYYYGPGLDSVAQGPTIVGSSPTVVASKPRKAKPAVVAGSYCDVPPVVGSDPVIVSSAPKARTGASTVVTRPGTPPPVIVSGDPGYADGWRRRSPETMARTRVSGSIDDELTR